MLELNARDLARLRKVAIQRQGLSRKSPFGRGIDGALGAVEHLGYVQIDTISVVQRAHHHVLASRVDNYDEAMLETLLTEGKIFEYWSHAAAFLPMRDFRFSLFLKQRINDGKVKWLSKPDRTMMRALLRRIQAEGPLRAKDLEGERSRPGGWWNWKPAKRALEQLYFRGEVMVCSRAGFAKAYDLTERVLPAGTDTRMPSYEEYATHLLDQQLACHGPVTLKGVTYQRRDADLRGAVKAEIERRIADRTLVEARQADGRGQPWLIEPDVLDARRVRVSSTLKILSPFDNVLIQRDRAADLFGFEYQIECYLPATKRKYGYYCLPLLYGDRLIGRADCKVHRQEGRLEVRHLHLEKQVATDARLVDAIRASFGRFAARNGCDALDYTKTSPARLRTELRRRSRAGSNAG